jgi:D-alanyl-D-alanine carboxypeptidase
LTGDIDSASSIQVVVNKKRRLRPITYKPAEFRYFNGVPLAQVAYQPLKRLQAAMKAAGAGTLILNSGYRSYESQAAIYAQKVAQLGLTAGERLAARPGYSEHQTGLAADVSAYGQGCVINICFSKTDAGGWIAANARRYGFIIRYPHGSTSSSWTGYQFEPWHLRYVGVEVATDMYRQSIYTLEKYRMLPKAPNY